MLDIVYDNYIILFHILYYTIFLYYYITYILYMIIFLFKKCDYKNVHNMMKMGNVSCRKELSFNLVLIWLVYVRRSSPSLLLAIVELCAVSIDF